LKNKTGLFVVLEGETFEQAYDGHYDGYTDIDHVKKDMKSEAKGTQFQVFSRSGELMGVFSVKDGEIEEHE
jgi:hypothetical protein